MVDQNFENKHPRTVGGRFADKNNGGRPGELPAETDSEYLRFGGNRTVVNTDDIEPEMDAHLLSEILGAVNYDKTGNPDLAERSRNVLTSIGEANGLKNVKDPHLWDNADIDVDAHGEVARIADVYDLDDLSIYRATQYGTGAGEYDHYGAAFIGDEQDLDWDPELDQEYLIEDISLSPNDVREMRSLMNDAAD